MMCFIRDNFKIISWVVGVTIVVFVLVVAGNRYQSYRTSKAADALYEAQKSAGDARQRALLNIADDYGGTPAGREAMMMSGDDLFARGDYAGALVQFENLATKGKGNPLMEAAALHKVAATQRALGKIEDAAKTYLSAAGNYKNLNKDESFYQAARCYEDLKQYGEAAKLYKRVIDSQSEGEFKSLSEERILWLVANGSISG